MNLFEAWYITFFNVPDVEHKETFRKRDSGEYYHYNLFMMHKAFRAGQVLRKG